MAMGCNSICFVSSVNIILEYAWINAVFFTVGTECLQVWYQEYCLFALVVLYSLERMKSPQSTYRHGRIYPVTAIIDSSHQSCACMCIVYIGSHCMHNITLPSWINTTTAQLCRWHAWTASTLQACFSSVYSTHAFIEFNYNCVLIIRHQDN